MRKQPQLQGKLLAKGSGIINWWMNWCRSPAILCCRSRATAVFQYAAGQHFAQPWNTPSGFHRYRYQRLRRIDATRRLFSGVFRRGAGRRNTVRAGICTESRVVQYRNLLAGSATSKRSATRFLPRPLLVSLKEFNDAKIRNYSCWQQRTAGPFVPGTLADGVVYVSGTLALINITTCCLPMTQRRKPATPGNHPQGHRDGGWHDGGCDLQQHLYYQLEKLRRD